MSSSLQPATQSKELVWITAIRSVKSYRITIDKDQAMIATFDTAVVVVAAIASVEWRRSANCQAEHGSCTSSCAQHTRTAHMMILVLIVLFVIGLAILGQQSTSLPLPDLEDDEDFLATRSGRSNKASTKKQKKTRRKNQKQKQKFDDKLWLGKPEKRAVEKSKVEDARTKALQKGQRKESAHEDSGASEVVDSGSGVAEVEGAWVELKKKAKKKRSKASNSNLKTEDSAKVDGGVEEAESGATIGVPMAGVQPKGKAQPMGEGDPKPTLYGAEPTSTVRHTIIGTDRNKKWKRH